MDYVAGNPPWVNWENLPQDYRQSTAPLWQRYGLFRQKGYKAKLGGAKDDISILMTYAAHDCYLNEEGYLGFVITQALFKTKGGGEGFRSFQYSDAKGLCFLRPQIVHDLSSFQPFEDAANRTAVVILGKVRSPFKYPIPYVVWTKDASAEFSQDDSLKHVMNETHRETLAAEPIDPLDRTSPWLTGRAPLLEALAKVRGTSSYTARKGVYCPTNAVYWLTDAKPVGKAKQLITNLADTGKTTVLKVTQAVESEFIHPLVRGKNVSRWRWSTDYKILLPQDPHDPARALPEKDLRKHFPATFAYFKQFEKELRSCALLAQFFDPDSDPFYSSYNVGTYTFQPYKVVWKEIASEIEAAVIAPGTSSVVIPDHKLVMVAFESAEEAHFLCALLNTSPVRALVRGYAVQTSISGHVCEYARLFDYSPVNGAHKALAELSMQCHESAACGDGARLAAAEAEIDRVAAKLWNITDNELKAIWEELPKVTGNGRSTRARGRRTPKTGIGGRGEELE